jgi:hypothetical protein
MAIIQEFFTSLPLGSTATPPGWTQSFQQSEVVAGIYPPHQALLIANGSIFQEFDPVTQCSLVFEWQLGVFTPGTTFLAELWGQQISNGQPFVLISVDSEADQSLSVYVGGHNVGNTALVLPPFYYERGTNFWIQLDVSITTDAITNTINFLTIRLWVDGVKYIDSSYLSGILASQVGSSFVWLAFGGGGTGDAFIQEITLQSLVDYPLYPNPGSMINSRVSTGITEIAYDHFDEHAYVSQGVAEIEYNHSDEHALVSQGVIEVMTKPTAVTSGWIVKEV